MDQSDIRGLVTAGQRCESRGESRIRDAVAAGATLQFLQKSLKCGTSRGSCVPELRRLAAG